VWLGPADLPGRIRKAESEGCWQQALELAKSLYKQTPSPENQELMKRVTLGRVGQLRAQGHLRDAATALENAIGLDPNAGWRDRIAGEMASCGEVRRALDLVRPFPDSPALPRIWALAADWSMSQGKADRALLPDEMLGQYELIHRAFSHLESGQDEEAKAALQGIGLRSPFLDWKMLARGLMAHYQDDQPRALENWSRLDPERLPARLAAPLRFTIDPEFRLAQPPATQTSLQQQADRLHSSALVKPMREIQAALTNEHKLPQAFRLAENVLPTLRAEAPLLAARLATCFYWAIISDGQPEDMTRYERVFGKAPDDPYFSRLQALTLEQRGALAPAHEAWQDFEKQLADGSVAWPGAQAARVRALIWDRMGNNAARALHDREEAAFPGFPGDRQQRLLNPGAEKCYKKSLQLEPNQRETYQNLFEVWKLKKKPAEAIKTARRLLERFPDDVPMLQDLGDLLLDQARCREGLEVLQRALHNNPLDRQLRDRVGFAHVRTARQYTEAGQFDEARKHYHTAEALNEGKVEPALLCKWAACEFKAGAADQAETMIERALAGGSRLGVAYSMLIETIRLKLPRPLKNRFDKEFKAALAEPPTPGAAVSVANTALTHKLAGVTYHGQKTHENKVIAYLEKAAGLDFGEDEMQGITSALLGLHATKAALAYVRRGRTRFPQSPSFLLAEAGALLLQDPYRISPLSVKAALDEAQKLVDALPPGDQKNAYLEQIRRQQDLLESLNPFSHMSPLGMFRDVFGDMLDIDDEDECTDEDDYF
jgi:predicted Zn-dependent protease